MKAYIYKNSIFKIILVSASFLFFQIYGEQETQKTDTTEVEKTESRAKEDTATTKNINKPSVESSVVKVNNPEKTSDAANISESKTEAAKNSEIIGNVKNQVNSSADNEKISTPSSNRDIDFEDLSHSELIDVKVDIEAPSYDRIIPISGWNRYSGDSASSIREWKRWWKYLRLSTPVVMQWIDGLLLRIYPENEIFRALFVRGIYDPNPIVVINAILPKDGVFIDVGATCGYVAMLATKAVGPNGSIIAIEPSSRDYNRLVDNIRINDLQNIISAYRFAVSDKAGKGIIKIATEERSALNTMGNDFSFKGIDKIAEESVDITTLDDFVSTSSLKNVHLIKLDIEGSELKALKGAKNTIGKFHPVIVLGVNENALKASGTNFNEIKQLLSELKYGIYKIVDKEHFSLQLLSEQEIERINVVFCFPKGSTIPVLPQPQSKDLMRKVQDFFLK